MPHVQLNAVSTKDRNFLWSVLAVAFLLRIFLLHAVHFTADDALITFRYVENLVAGHGFVYNTGEHVLGTTTPLFTLLLSGFALFGLSPFVAASLINAIGDCVIAWILYAIFTEELSGVFRLIPSIVFLFN